MAAAPANEKLLALRALLKRHAWTEEELCLHAGVSDEAYRQLVYENQSNPRRMYKIEKALGAPIWTDAMRFADLKRASDFLGVDFILNDFHPVRRAAVAKGVRGTRRLTNKNALLARVLAHLSETQTHASK
jgi:hypothetical protein